MSKRKDFEEDEYVDPNDILHFVNLGAGNEVGRSCHIIQFKGKTIMLDAGIHPAYSGFAALPFFDEFDLSTVDILLITHFHLDHAAALPYVMQKTNFRGRVFMTHPTKAVCKWLLSDYVRVSNVGVEDQLYDEKDLAAAFERMEAVDYHSTIEVEGVKFTPFHAGHVLGACMYFIEIAGVKLLYTGDFSREEDRHLNIAEVPPQKPNILISESTYGTASHQPRLDKEARLLNLVHTTVRNGGRVLMPVFALGRAQELLLILDEYWHSHAELRSVPIYYASSLARKCMAVYQTYINMMNDKIRKAFAERNPFIFRYIKSLRSIDKFDDIGPSVILASPGMLQNGVSRTLLERWAPDARNTLLLTGYSVEGTMAKLIANEPIEITTLSGQKIPRRMTVEELSFAAHVDYIQNSEFIDAVNPDHIILVHGEQTNTGRLKSALMSKYHNKKMDVKVYNPKNCVPLELHFKGDRIVKALGNIAIKKAKENDIVSGILVQKDSIFKLMVAENLRDFSDLTTTVVMQKQVIPFYANFSLARYHLEQMFGNIKETRNKQNEVQYVVMDAVTITQTASSKLVLEWVGNVMNDTIVDSVIAILLGVESSPASVKITKQKCTHHHDTVEDRVERLILFLKAQFGDSITRTESGVDIKFDKFSASINFSNMSVQCESEVLKTRIVHVLSRAVSTILPFVEPDQLESMENESSAQNDDNPKKIEDKSKQGVAEYNPAETATDSSSQDAASTVDNEDEATTKSDNSTSSNEDKTETKMDEDDPSTSPPSEQNASLQDDEKDQSMLSTVKTEPEQD
ncbi:mRNA cleavage and polyadenylation specificity factor complex subunit Ysh1 [Schizosaccharomyces japonicus yFS275]|uniref:Endoribonuclease YSH1 n=1 Tax=Schizosaccharomyces japonicus (strain yFS275 / FY16936) TaxID=402676 RepID=B6K781_SCHJY|nr:mRNA cleavage and polyadenylation specificity factor complex subunit Ysh1 [Schizosaccharomyces japonicus yFS275]EEB09385.2 mRNA cleavage and polyadenylation specificity factor complex subunit Ysh1 [Schizosaccharomyces japonicus yFS275]